MLLKYGIDIKNNLVATAKNARKLSSTHGAGGILDLFYPKWKIDLTFHCNFNDNSINVSIEFAKRP